MGVTEELRVFSKDYFTIILLGNIFSTGFSSIIRAEGKMRYGLLIWAIPITLNIILDAVFILLLGWGVKGSAYATVACQFTSFSMSILFFTRFTTLEFKGARLNFGVIREILLIGLPTLVQASTSSFSLVLINNVLKFSSGTLAINTYAYLNKILLFAAIPIISLMQSINPIVGYNYGAKNHDRVRQTIRFSILVSIAYAILALIVFEVKPEVFILLFTDNAEIIGLAARAMRIIAISLPFTPLAMLIGSTYQAQGRIGKALLMYAIDIIFMVPCAILMAAKMGLDGVWWSLVVTKILSTGFVALFILTRGKIGSGQRPGHNSP
jgi:putative MATE family efflux protein